MRTMFLIDFHWWCLRQAAKYDRPGYSIRAFAFDWIGGRAVDLFFVLL